MPTEPKHLGILLFPDVEELDAVGPWEVLSFWTRTHPEDGYAIHTFALEAGPVRCAKGLTVMAVHSYADLPPLEVLIYPGGSGTRPQLHDDAQLDWVRRQRTTVPLLTSVCTGHWSMRRRVCWPVDRPPPTGDPWICCRSSIRASRCGPTIVSWTTAT